MMTHGAEILFVEDNPEDLELASLDLAVKGLGSYWMRLNLPPLEGH